MGLDLKEFFTTPSKMRTIVFIATGAILGIIIIVVIAVCASKGGNGHKDPISHEGFEGYLDSNKYLYVWGYPNGDNFIQFVKDHKFKRVYLYVGCIEWNVEELERGEFYDAGDRSAKEIIKRLHDDCGVDVHLAIYLNDKVNNLTNYERVSNVAKALKTLQKTVPFTTLHFDQEPSDPAEYPKLFSMFELAKAQKIRVSTTLKPKWIQEKMIDIKDKFNSTYYEKFKDCETVADAIMTITDAVDLMAYSNSYEGTDNFLAIFKTIKSRHKGVEAKPIIEMDSNVKSDSLYAEYAKDKKKFFDYTNNLAKEWDGLTFHQYEVWFKDLYCYLPKKDNDYYFGEPLNCNQQ